MATAQGRGSRAQRPSGIPRRGWREILRRTKEEVARDNMALVAAGVAFFGLLALFPLLIAVISIFGLVMSPADVERSVEQLFTAMPADAKSVVETQLRRIASTTGSGLGWGLFLSLAAALFAASSGVSNLMKALSLAYDEEPRGFLRARLVALALTLGAILLFGAGLVLIVGGPILFSALGLTAGAAIAAQAVRWLALSLLFVVGVGVLYHFGPNRDRPRWRWVTVGSVVATVLFLVVSVGFSFYVSRFGSYNETYGALGGVIVLLLWLYLAAFSVLIGAELNAEAEHQTLVDTTIGEARPMGERGAFVADTPASRSRPNGEQKPNGASPPAH